MELSQFIEEVLARGFWLNFGYFVITVPLAIIGLLSYLRDRTSTTNRTFLIFTLGLAFWAVITYLYTLPFEKNVSLYLNRFAQAYALLLGGVLMHFYLVFPKKKMLMPWYEKLVFLASVPLFIITIFTDSVYYDVKYYSWGPSALNGPLLPITVIWITGCIVIAIVSLQKRLKKSKGRERTQMQYLLLAVFIGAIYVVPMNLIFPAMTGLMKYDIYGPLGLNLFSFFVFYAIFRHRLLDIRLVVVKSAVYITLVSLIVGAYVLLVFFAKKYFESIINPDLVFITAFSLALAFQPLKRFLQKYADRIFAKGQYNFEGLLTKISNILSSNLVLTSLAPDLLKTLSSELKVNKIAFYKDAYQESLGLNLSAKDSRKLLNIEYIDTLVSDELEDDSPTKKLMQKLGIEVMVFFPDSENKPLGLLALSEKASGDAYTARDLKLLEIIAPQISIALKNIEQQQQMIENIVEERQRINQDAHDHIYNRLGALAKKAEVALLNPKETESTLNLLKSDLSQTVTDLQRIVSGEIEEGSKELPLLHELERICNDFKKQSPIKLSYQIDDNFANKLKPNCFWHLQCILEECLNNIRKHSGATQVKVALQTSNGSVVLKVEDNGKGFIKKDKTDLENHYGLKGMKQRAGKIGARLSITSNNGKGTKVELELPC